MKQGQLYLYEAPHRLKRTLKELYEALGNRRLQLSGNYKRYMRLFEGQVL